MKKIYTPVLLILLLLPFASYATNDNHPTKENPPCTAEIITTDQEICDDFFQIFATPPEAGETGVWTGPVNTSFSNPTAATTFVTNLNAGPNDITWTIFDSNGVPCSVAELTLINNEVQTTPTITTPNNTEVCDENGFQVEAEGPLLPGEVGQWSANNTSVTFSNPSSLTTIANNLVSGNNVIFWTISNGTGCTSNPASITVINNEVVTTAAIELFSAEESCVTNGFDNVFANISDPNNQLVPGEDGTWSTVPPNIGVTFSPNSEAPTVNGLLPGDNVLVWTISRGNCPVNSDTIIITNNEPNNVNINIGDSDTSACAADALNLAADPPNANQTGMWTGPAGAVFAPNASSPTVSVTGTPTGSQTFYWTLMQGNCDLSDSIQVEIFAEPVGSYMVNNTTTVGGNDGSIDVCVEGGTPPFDITWAPSSGTLTTTTDADCPGLSYNIGGLLADSYVVTITDSNGCFDILGDGSNPGDTITIMDPDCSDFDFGLISSTNESCDEADDGTITVEVLNAQGNILYSVGNVNGVPDVTTTENPYTFENLPEGEYNLFISDERLCTDSYIGNPVIITAPAPLAVTPVGVPTLTLGGADGSITVCINGGTGPYTVTWTPQAGGSVGPDPNASNCDDNQIITGLIQGDYDVMVVDANGCEINSSGITVNEPICDISLDVSDIVISNVSCNGENDGSITIGGVTDTPPLEYSITGGSPYFPANVFDNLPPGNYLVFIRDGQNCSAGPVSIDITEPAPLNTTELVIGTTTVGGNDGQIQLCIEGGTPPSTVTWSPSDVGSVGPATDPNCDGEVLAITGLSAGEYDVTITDSNGCVQILDDIVELPDPACTSVTEVVFMDNSCGISPTNPSFDGTIEVTIVGDAPAPYIIAIGCGVDSVTTNETTYTFTGLEPCNYVIQVTSADNCTIGFTGNPVTIDAPPILSAPFTITETSTISGNDGEICLEPMGGTPPYMVTICGEIAMEGGACNGFFLGGLMTGDTCNVLVQDANLCESTGVLFISGPDCSSFLAELDGMNGVMGSCAESNTGAINLNVTGGMEPYTFVWSNGATTEDLTDLPGGTYTVTVSDVQECEVIIESIEVETFDPVEVTLGITINGMFSQGNEFEITSDPLTLGVEVNFPIASVLWTPPDGLDDPTSLTPTALPEETTTYTVTVTTEEGCMASDTIRIIAEPIIIVVPTGFTPNGDGNNDTFYPVIDGNVDVLGFTVWNRWGEKVYDNPDPPGWDGFYKTVKQPLSSFVYVLEYKLPGKDPEVLKGDFVLIR